ncbi:STE3-domain-containing protein [Phlebopus sp. FC_14]|nr:STE3-domain-containing protein [Phlebopus sp. FC_14]
MVPSNAAFSVFSFVGFVLVCIPLSFHLQYKNVGACMCMAWTGLACLAFFINSIVWNDNVTNWAPVWCDITSHIVVASSVGIPASSLSIMRQLYHITRRIYTYQTQHRTKTEFYVQLSIGVGLPCLVMILYYIVQTNRFDIYEQIGCYPAAADSLPTFLLLDVWPILLGFISSVYAGLTIRMISKRKSRSRMTIVLRSNENISKAQYWRLMVLCIIQLMCTIPIDSYVVSMSAAGDQVLPYSWDSVHGNFSQVNQIPVEEWQSSAYGSALLETNRWLYVICAFVFFGFFGLGKEARMTYGQLLSIVLRRCGFPGMRGRPHSVGHSSAHDVLHLSFSKAKHNTNATTEFSTSNDDNKAPPRDSTSLLSDHFHDQKEHPAPSERHKSVPNVPPLLFYPAFPDPVWFPYHSDSRRSSSKSHPYGVDSESERRRKSLFNTSRNPSS